MRNPNQDIVDARAKLANQSFTKAELIVLLEREGDRITREIHRDPRDSYVGLDAHKAKDACYAASDALRTIRFKTI